MWNHFLLDPLRGKTPLLHVVVGCFVANGVLFLPLALLQPRGNVAVLAAVFAGLAVGLVESVMVWQCAFNSPFRHLGVFLRVSVAVSWISLPIFLYAAISNPGAVQFGG